MKMIEHPAQGMSTLQRRTFEAIATGHTKHEGTRRTLAALQRRGLIEPGEPKILPHDAYGFVQIKTWTVPQRVHAQWCQWCAERSKVL